MSDIESAFDRVDESVQAFDRVADSVSAFDRLAPPPMTNHLAHELRGILDDLHDAEHGDVPKPLVRERLERLAEYVERLATDPVEVDASTELTASFGLEPDQEVRARAAEIVGPPPATNKNAMVVWDSQVVTLAAYIRTGERPA